MPSVSPKQKRTMQAVKHDPAFAAKMGIPQKVGREFVAADKAAPAFSHGGMVKHGSPKLSAPCRDTKTIKC